MDLTAVSVARDPRTLRFLDPRLEADYRLETADPTRRRLVQAAIANVPLWVIGALIAPLFFPIDPAPLYAIAAAISCLLIGMAIFALRPRSPGAVTTALLVVNIAAGIGICLLTALTGTFDRFAAFLLLFAAVNGLAVQRLPFLPAIAGVVAHLTAFIVVGVVVATALVLQVFLLGSALLVLLSGAYMVEDAERRLFAQRRTIADLHRQVDELFHRYLSPDVAAALLSSPERAGLGGEQVEVTVLFADLTGFTPFSERVEPASAVAMLNEVFSVVVPIVLGAGGTVVQFAGDALMAIFNAPVRQTDHALRAAAAALEMQAGMARLPADLTRPRFRVGLNTGIALVGNVGSAELRNFTAIGDTTNLAARLQTFAAPGSIVIGPRTRELLGDTAIVEPLGEQVLKGKASPVEVFELHGLRASSTVLRPLEAAG